jgi:hypothetical protein
VKFYLPSARDQRPIRFIPGTQIKYLERLDKDYDFTNGTYNVYAYKIVGLPQFVNGKPVFSDSQMVKSATVPIKIEAPQ